MHLTRQMRCLHFCQSVNSPLRISPYTASAFFKRSQAPSVTFGDSSLSEGANLRKKRHYFHSTSFFIFCITVFSEEILRIVFRYSTRRRRSLRREGENGKIDQNIEALFGEWILCRIFHSSRREPYKGTARSENGKSK